MKLRKSLSKRLAVGEQIEPGDDHPQLSKRVWINKLPHDLFMELLGKRIADGRVQALIEGFLKATTKTPRESPAPARGQISSFIFD